MQVSWTFENGKMPVRSNDYVPANYMFAVLHKYIRNRYIFNIDTFRYVQGKVP